jgi:hypothetical protein
MEQYKLQALLGSRLRVAHPQGMALTQARTKLSSMNQNTGGADPDYSELNNVAIKKP